MAPSSFLTKLTAATATFGSHLTGAVTNRAGHIGTVTMHERAQTPRVYAVTKLRSIPHVDQPWTQGLEMNGGLLVESVGGYPDRTNSYVRTIDTRNGNIVDKTAAGSVFLEGIAKMGDHWFASTWNDKEVEEYDASFKFVQKHSYPYEGWGLTRAASGQFLATNGGPTLFSLDDAFKPAGEKTVTCLGKDVHGMNELESVDNFGGHGRPAVLGNIMNTRLVLAIDPDTAVCMGVFHLKGLEKEETKEADGFHVANGIAHDAATGNFWVTGKNWKDMFEISLAEQAAGEDDALSLLDTYLDAPVNPGALVQIPTVGV